MGPRTKAVLRILCALATAPLASADVIFTLTPSALPAQPGGTASFTGTLENTGSSVVFLNGDLFSVPDFPLLTIDDSPFFNDAPLFLNPNGDSYSGAFFNILVDPSTPTGPYTGSFTIQGGADSNTFDDLATQNFEVDVGSTSPPTNTPEPGSLSLTAMTLALLGLTSVRRGGHSSIKKSPNPS
jgi:hypothetical protein